MNLLYICKIFLIVFKIVRNVFELYVKKIYVSVCIIEIFYLSNDFLERLLVICLMVWFV